MAALTLNLTAQHLHVLPGAVRSCAKGRSDAMPVGGEIRYLAALCLLNEQAAFGQTERLETALAGLSREQVLQLARWARKLGLKLLPLVLLAEASVRHSGNPREAKGEVRQAIALLVRDGAEATALLAYWLQRAGSKARLPNALKKGLSEALAAMNSEQLLTGPLALPLKDLLCLVHARPCDAEQEALYRRLLEGEVRENQAQNQSLTDLAAREQSDAEALIAEIGSARLSALRWLMLEREAETQEVKTALRLALADALVQPLEWSGRTAVLVNTGKQMLARLSERPALQHVDIAAMLAALAAMAQPCRLAAYATEVRWLSACAFPVETALQLRQADTGWGEAAWKAVAALIEQREALEKVLVLSAGEPDAALLASWQRYLQIVNPQARLIFVDLTAESQAIEVASDGSGLIRISGWSEKLLEILALY